MNWMETCSTHASSCSIPMCQWAYVPAMVLVANLHIISLQINLVSGWLAGSRSFVVVPWSLVNWLSCKYLNLHKSPDWDAKLPRLTATLISSCVGICRTEAQDDLISEPNTDRAQYSCACRTEKREQRKMIKCWKVLNSHFTGHLIDHRVFPLPQVIIYLSQKRRTSGHIKRLKIQQILYYVERQCQVTRGVIC